MLFKGTISLLIFCLDNLSIDVNGVLESPTIIALLSVSPSLSVNVCFVYLGAPVLDALMFTNVIASLVLIPLSSYTVLLCLLL